MNAGNEQEKGNDDKKAHDEKNSPEKPDNKRRDSVTGSLLDTGSSSNSSVDSDGLELLENCCGTKATMASSSAVDIPPSSEAIKEANSDTKVEDDDVKEELSKPPIDQGVEKNAKSMDGMFTANDEVDQISLGKGGGHRRATKKQFRRERRQKEKEKRNGENQHQQGQEKAMRHRLEKALVVQNLLSLRIAENQPVVQKRSQQPVPVSFGDFPEQNRTRPQSQPCGFATFPELNTAKENDLVQVYTTGNKLHGLFRCEESRIPSSKVQLSVDNNSNYSSAVGSQDGMEVENVLKMVDDSNKLAQRYSHWMRSFHNSLVDGDPDVFMNKFNCILRILKKSSGRARYERMTQRQFTEHVMIGVIRQFYNERQRTTVLHQLAATRNVGKPCPSRDHGSCKMIRLILGMLSWEDMRATMRIRTSRTGKTAMHLAASTGQPCQLEALMSYDMCPNTLDRSGRAPIHYAVANNDVYLVKMLLWYGADLSLMERQCTPLQLASLNPCTLEVANFLDMRRDALEKLFMRWTTNYVRGVWTPIRAISDLHFMRLSKEGDSREDAVRTIETAARSTTLNIRVNVAQNPEFKKYPLSLLFIVPTFYKNDDRYCDATDPQIFRASITSDLTGDAFKLIQPRPLLKGKNIDSTPLKAAFTNPHNGHFYVFQLPRTLPQDVYTLNFSVNTEPIKAKAPHINLAIQAIACDAPEQRYWEAIHRGIGKTKID
uniref:ANK_REP_REGION domain-containing protein n=2 Tax=Parascaris univalens TaxID=6257 RepID=A0A915B5I6_PARUN